MVKNLKVSSLFLFAFILFSPQFFSQQLNKGDLIDGVAAVIGDEIVLESDVAEQMNFAQQQGVNITNKCDFLNGLIDNKLLIYEAKRDTLIEIRKTLITQIANQKYNSILRGFPDEKTMLKAYGFRTNYEMKKAIERIDTDNEYGQQKYARIAGNTDISPSEVTDYFNTYRFQLPEVKDEVTIAQIVRYPVLTDTHKQELIDKLKKIKEDIVSGKESFENMARIYSEDPGSASNGGLYQKIAKGQMVKAFESAALNLQEGEISDPVESEYGFHIIQLVKKSGRIYDARHILLSAKPNPEEIEAAKKELEEIKNQIQEGKITFKDAAFKYSDDRNTKFNAGIIPGADGGDRIEKLNLSSTLAYQIAGLHKGDMTDVFEDELNSRKTVNLVTVNDIIDQHQLDITTDYERIKKLALEKKKKEIVDQWVKERMPSIFLSINKRYASCNLSEWQKKAVQK